MWIEKAWLRNYGPIVDLTVDLSPGINVLVGPNNAGKSSILRMLSGAFPSKAHRSLHYSGTFEPGRATLTLRVSPQDVRDSLHRDGAVVLPRGTGAVSAFDAWMHGHGVATIIAKCASGGDLIIVDDESFGLYAPDGDGGQPGNRQRLSVVEGPDGQWVPAPKQGGGQFAALEMAADYPKVDVLLVEAERRFQPVWQPLSSGELAQNADNLAGVLDHLRGDDYANRLFLEYVQVVFPEVRSVTVDRLTAGATIRVWFHDPADRNRDLTIALQDCGTGFVNGLAIIYAAMMSERQRVILLDEPQSFLHPGALRRLFGLIRETKHQYVIATHSPLVLAQVDKAHRVDPTHAGTAVKSFDRTELTDVHSVLRSLGCTSADLFGADALLWVEGETEQKCFPAIIRVFANRPKYSAFRRAITICALPNTGDFDRKGKDAEKVLNTTLDAYSRVGGVTAVMPPRVAWVLDTEQRSADRLKDLGRRGVYFIKPTMFEDHLLHADAITAVLSDAVGHAVKLADVEAALAELSLGHAADTLIAIFGRLGEAHPYDKIRHGHKIVQWLAEHHPERLEKLADLLLDALGPAPLE